MIVSLKNPMTAKKELALKTKTPTTLVASAVSTVFAVLTLAVTTPAAAEVATFKVDPSHTTVRFAVDHLVISTVTGVFKDFSGELTLDPNNLTSLRGEGVVQVASIDTRDEKRDEHLRSADFFDVEKHPTMTLKMKEVKNTRKGHVAIADLTIRGVTKQVEIPFEYRGMVTDPWGNVKIGLKGSFSINRQDFGISWNKVLDSGGLVVGDIVTVNLDIEANKQ